MAAITLLVGSKDAAARYLKDRPKEAPTAVSVTLPACLYGRQGAHKVVWLHDAKSLTAIHDIRLLINRMADRGQIVEQIDLNEESQIAQAALTGVPVPVWKASMRAAIRRGLRAQPVPEALSRLLWERPSI